MEKVDFISLLDMKPNSFPTLSIIQLSNEWGGGNYFRVILSFEGDLNTSIIESSQSLREMKEAIGIYRKWLDAYLAFIKEQS